jgi:outer membrane autotransporter protein
MAATSVARRAGLLGGSAVALVAALAGGRSALALDECGPGAPGGTVTCTPAGNPFDTGIQYKVNDLTIVVQDGVIIDTTTKAGEPGGVVSGGNGNYGDLVVKAGTASGSGVTITTNNDDADGISVASNDGSATITAFADITTSFKNGDAISAKTTAGDISISTTGDLDVDGFYGHGIRALSDTGKITITHTGDIETYGPGGFGIRAITKNDISVTVDGNITARDSDAILAQATLGNTTISMTGDISTVDDDAGGLDAVAKDGTVTINQIGDIATLGERATAIEAEGFKGITITSVGNITTDDKESLGIDALAKAGAISITATGDIATTDADSIGIRADTSAADGNDIEITFAGDLRTAGEDSTAIAAAAAKSDITISFSGGGITTSGDSAQGIAAYSKGYTLAFVSGDVATGGFSATGIELIAADDGKIGLLLNGDVQTTGKTADGISAIAENGGVAMQLNGDIITDGESSIALTAVSDSAVVIVINGEVQGGWTGIGVNIDSGGTAGLGIEAGARIGALSDVTLGDGDDGLVLNSLGTITGSASLGKGDEEFKNGGTWNLRNFQDLDGDQSRDKEAVALIDLGADTDSFANTGTLSLAAASGATIWDTTGQILHPGGGNSDITQEGVEQGFLLGLETFNHSGLITLSDGVAGDLLVITDQADGKTKGANLFTSNGGALALDAVLDDGTSKQSDVLILDKAATGTGATRVLVSNAGGSGGQTTGDGILVINVRDTSDADAFVLGNTPVAGAYQYDLVYQNAAKTDQNWYLTSSFFEGSLEYPAIVSGVLETWQAGLGSLHDQIRSRRNQVEMQDVALAELPNTATDIATGIADSTSVRMNDAGQAGWLRVSGSDMEIEQGGSADFDVSATRAEAGFDVGFGDLVSPGDWLVTGAFAGYGWSQLGFDGGSDADFDIATVGAYATYFRGPYYLDAVMKLDWLDGNFSSENVSDDGDISLPVFGLSLQSGYRFDLTMPQNWGGLYLQPQAQLAYAHSGDDSFTDNSGSRIELEDADSLRGRLGARLGQELQTTAGAAAEPVRGNFYVEASVNQEFLGETQAKVTGLTLNQELPETTFALGGGFDIALPKDGISFTVDADYILGDEAEGFAATGGFRIQW